MGLILLGTEGKKPKATKTLRGTARGSSATHAFSRQKLSSQGFRSHQDPQRNGARIIRDPRLQPSETLITGFSQPPRPSEERREDHPRSTPSAVRNSRHRVFAASNTSRRLPEERSSNDSRAAGLRPGARSTRERWARGRRPSTRERRPRLNAQSDRDRGPPP